MKDEKKCKDCGEWKKKKEFCKDKNSKDGLCIYCRKCKAIRDKKTFSKWYAKEENREKKKNYNKTDKGRAIGRKASKKWSDNNKDIKKVKNKERYEKTVNRIKAGV